MDFAVDSFLYQYDFLQFLLATAFFFIGVVSYVLYDETEGGSREPWKWFCLFAFSVFFCRLAGVFISHFIDPAFILVPRLFMLMVSNAFLSFFVSSCVPQDSPKKHITLLAVMFLGAVVLSLLGELTYAYALSYLLVFVPISVLSGQALLVQSSGTSGPASKYLRMSGYLMMLLGIFLPFPLSSSFAGVVLLVLGLLVAGTLCFCLWMYLDSVKIGPVFGNKDADSKMNASMFFAVILILIFGFVLVNVVAHYAHTASLNEARLHLAELKESLEYKVNKSDSMVKALSGSPFIMPALLAGTSENLKNANSVLDRYRRAMDVSICYLMDDKGTVLASSNRDESLSFVGKNYSFREYYSDAMQGKAGRQFAVGVTTHLKGYYSAFPVFGPKNSILGVVAVKVDIEDDKLGGDQMLFILTNGGKELFAANLKIKEVFGQRLVTESLSGGSAREFVFKGNRYLMLSEKVGNIDARLGIITPLNLIVYIRMFAIAITFLLVFVAGLGNHFIRKQRYGNIILKRNQEELLRKTNELEGFFGVNLDLLCIADLEGNFIKVNKEWENVLGYSVGELEKRKFLEFVHPDDMQATLAEMAKLSNNEQVLDFTNRYRCKDGSYRYIEWRSHPHDKLIYAAARDITNRKKMEQSLRDNEQWLDKSLMSIGDGVVSCDTRGNVAFMNPVAEKITGWTRQDAVNRPIGQVMSLINENTGEPVENPVSMVLKEGKAFELANHTILVSKDGRRIPIDDSAAPINDKDGKTLGVILVFRDVTAKREYDRKLRQLSRAVENSPASIVITDTDGNIQYVNPKFCDLTGYSAEEAKGQNPRILKSGSQTAEFYKELWGTITAGNVWHGELHNKKKDGSLYWEYASISPIKGEDGRVINYLAVKEDITEKKKTEQDLERDSFRKEKLLELAKMRGRSVKEVTNFALETCVALTKSKVGFFHFYDEDKGDITLNTWSKEAMRECSVNQDQHYPLEKAGIWADSVRQGKAVIINDYQSQAGKKGYPSGHFPVRRFISVPIFDGGKIVMICGVGNRDSEYSQNDVDEINIFMISAWSLLVEMRAAKELEMSEKRYHVISEQSPIAIEFYDKNGIIMSVNPACLRLFGIQDAHELEGFQLFDDPNISADHKESLKQGKTISYESIFDFDKVKELNLYQTSRSGKIWIEVLITPIRSDDNNVEGYLLQIQEVTGRKKAEEDLRENRAFLESIVENIPAMIFVKNAADLRFELFNRAGEELLGSSRQDLLGKNDYDFFPKDQADFFTAKDREVIIAKSELDIPEEKIVTKSKGERILHTKKITVLDDAGEPAFLLGISEDITEKKRSEEQLLKSKEDAERSRVAAMNLLEDLTETKQKLEKYSKELEEAIEVKSYFVSMVSHELRTPLTAVKEGIGIVHDGSAGKLNREQKQFLEIAKRNVDRLHRLIDDVLDFSKLEAKKIPFQMMNGDLGKTIREAAVSQENVAKAKGLYLKVDIPENMPQVKFDPDRITQVMVNLLSNAIKFTQKGGIDVYAIIDREENSVKVCVKDTGVGIRESDIGSLFQKFSQLGGVNERRTGGTGLGLAISKEVIEQHHGRIWGESREGEGSRFFFTLPIGS